MKNILIPTDFSPISNKAIEYTINFIGSLGGAYKILLLNAYHVPKTDSAKIIWANDQAKLKSTTEVLELRNQLLNSYPNQKLSIETLSVLGSLANVIPRTVDENEIDLVVMGKNGGTHVEQVSYALKVSTSQCPLMIVF